MGEMEEHWVSDLHGPIDPGTGRPVENMSSVETPLAGQKLGPEVTSQFLPPPEPFAREEAGDSIRGKVLTEAHDLITGDRNNQYGPPTQDFQRTAEILNAIGYRRPGGKGLQPHDVAVIQIALKMSRVTWTPDKRDSWVDIAGYAACGYECADEEVVDG